VGNGSKGRKGRKLSLRGWRWKERKVSALSEGEKMGLMGEKEGAGVGAWARFDSISFFSRTQSDVRPAITNYLTNDKRHNQVSSFLNRIECILFSRRTISCSCSCLVLPYHSSLSTLATDFPLPSSRFFSNLGISDWTAFITHALMQSDIPPLRLPAQPLPPFSFIYASSLVNALIGRFSWVVVPCGGLLRWLSW